jgi:DNA-binding IscR family transcriptional regulator
MHILETIAEFHSQQAPVTLKKISATTGVEESHLQSQIDQLVREGYLSIQSGTQSDSKYFLTARGWSHVAG